MASDLRSVWKQLAKMQPRYRCADALEFTANLQRRLGFWIERLVLRLAASHEKNNTRLGSTDTL